jgi:hypothetical protein
MSTFTRLYFVNRGPHLADTDSQHAPVGRGFVASETIPLDPGGPSALEAAELANLPQPLVSAGEIPRLQRSPVIGYATAATEGNHDHAR